MKIFTCNIHLSVKSDYVCFFFLLSSKVRKHTKRLEVIRLFRVWHINRNLQTQAQTDHKNVCWIIIRKQKFCTETESRYNCRRTLKIPGHRLEKKKKTAISNDESVMPVIHFTKPQDTDIIVEICNTKF